MIIVLSGLFISVLLILFFYIKGKYDSKKREQQYQSMISCISKDGKPLANSQLLAINIAHFCQNVYPQAKAKLLFKNRYVAVSTIFFLAYYIEQKYIIGGNQLKIPVSKSDFKNVLLQILSRKHSFDFDELNQLYTLRRETYRLNMGEFTKVIFDKFLYIAWYESSKMEFLYVQEIPNNALYDNVIKEKYWNEFEPLFYEITEGKFFNCILNPIICDIQQELQDTIKVSWKTTKNGSIDPLNEEDVFSKALLKCKPFSEIKDGYIKNFYQNQIDTKETIKQSNTSNQKEFNIKNILYCNKCGSKLLPSSNFCSFCGNKIKP